MPKGLQKVQFSFEAEGLTRYGGLFLFRSFCKFLGLRRFLQTYVHWPDYIHREYHPADLFLAHVFAIVAGIGRIANTQSLIHNGLVPALLGLPVFPHRKTLRDFLHRFEERHLRSLVLAHDRLRGEWMQRLGLVYDGVIDADSTILTVFGNQEATAIGFNRKYRGRASYAPVISSEGKRGMSLGLELRAGNIHPANQAVRFLETMLEKLPSTVAASRTRVRLDGGFYDKAVVAALVSQKVGYAIVAKMTNPLKRVMLSARYHEYAAGGEAAEFSYAPFNWKNPHRFIAVRRPTRFENESQQRNLFTFRNPTDHRAIVHDLDLAPENVYRFYCDRGFQELLLREFKDAYAMAKIPTRRFWANAAYMEMILWAYDLVLAFQLLCLPEEVRDWNIATLRRELWGLPAEWIKRGNVNTLRFPRRYPHQAWFMAIHKATSRVKSLI